MATWNAKCYLGTKGGYQNLQVEAASVNGARQQFERVYGSQQTINIRRVGGDSNSGGFDMGAIEGISSLLFWIGAFLVYMYWQYIIILDWCVPSIHVLEGDCCNSIDLRNTITNCMVL